MTSRQDEIKALLAGEPLPAHRIVELRSKAMHALRFEFIVRLLRSGVTVDTLTIYWDRGYEFMQKREVDEARCRLTLGRRNAVSGEFPDIWLLCYPDDAEIKQLAELEIDRMVDKVRVHSGQ
jgi:hypothetical protein